MAGREQWISRRGFILATIGAAVGLGNIWRFSYVAGENGGGAFLLLYVVCVVLIGLPLVIAELAMGRRGQGDAVAAFAIGGRGWPWIGWLCIAGAAVILSYYAVIAGWALKYFVGAATGSLWSDAAQGYGGYFRRFIANLGEPVGWQAAILGATMFVVAGGVARGIEAFNRLVMPLLALLLVGLAAYALSLPNSGAGARFLLAPDWSALGRPEVWAAAMGQAFFSLGVGMAIFVTYGSYMPRTFSLPVSATAVVVGDTLFAIVAGLAVFPGVFAFGVDPAAGPELAFITLPQVFLRMPGGTVVGAIFFFLLAAAALTSMVSLLEVPVSMAIHRLGMSRWRATALFGAVIFVLGLPSAMSFGALSHVHFNGRGVLDAVDAAVSGFLLPAGGILIALFVGWRLRRAEVLQDADFKEDWLGRSWLWLLRTVVPAAVIVILARSLFAG
ncbi:MAG: hypothetical protein RL477_858 [Pseudomonadota bacterium]